MAINTLALATLFQTQLDEQMVQEATTGWMEANAGQVKYSGGNTVKVPKISTTGYGNYDRDLGYPQGSVSLAYETLTLGQDRGLKFQLDKNDVDETNFVANAAAAMTDFQKTQAIPEIDSYRYSKLSALAIAAGKTNSYKPTTTDILGQLLNDISTMQDVIGENEPLVISMSYPIANVLSQADKITRMLDVSGQISQGGVALKVTTLNGIPIIRVPSARLKTAYVFNDARTTGQMGGGFAAASSALDINWIISARRAPIAISKTDEVKIFDPNANQGASAWLIETRKYHEMWVLDNKLPGVWVSTKAAS